MNHAAGKIIYPFFLPNGLLFIFFAVALAQPVLPAQILPFVDVFPYVVVSVGLFLGWRFNRTRLAQVIILLVLAEVLVVNNATAADRSLLFDLLVLLLPLNLWLVSCFKDEDPEDFIR